MSDEFSSLNLQFDDDALGRMEQLEFLSKIKDWALKHALLIAPINEIANIITDPDPDIHEVERVRNALPLGSRLIMKSCNDLYDLFQTEAMRQMGEPFQVWDRHTPHCDGSTESCGNQEHWLAEYNAKQKKEKKGE
jgi:hypothetical protein